MAGLKPIVIEGDRVGQGSSGRSAGLLLGDPGPLFRDVAQAHGVRAARRVFEAWGARRVGRRGAAQAIEGSSRRDAGQRRDGRVSRRRQAARA